MNDKELADKVVALGVCRENPMSFDLLDNDGDACAIFNRESELVRDWRVAGALIEKKLQNSDTMFLDFYPTSEKADENFQCSIGFAEVDDKSLPRAIIEACVKARK